MNILMLRPFPETLKLDPEKKNEKKARKGKPRPFSAESHHTHPVGLGSPAILQAPLPGPDGNNS